MPAFRSRSCALLLLISAIVSPEVCAWNVCGRALTLGCRSNGVLTLRATTEPAKTVNHREISLASRRSVLVSAFSVGIAATPAFAAVPSMDEYNVGSGTVIRPAQQDGQREAFVPPSDKTSALEAIKKADTQLDGFKSLIDKQAWDNIRAQLQSVPVTQKYAKPDRPGVIMSPFLGLKSKDDLRKVLGLEDKAAAAVEKARKDSSQALQELAEFAFTNRIPFFNDEDKKSVAQLAEKNVNVDLDEAKDMVVRAQDSIAELVKLLSQ